MFCKACGKEIEDGAQFCKFCGKVTETAANSEIENSENENGKNCAKQNEASFEKQGANEVNSNKTGKKSFLTLLCTLLSLILTTGLLTGWLSCGLEISQLGFNDEVKISIPIYQLAQSADAADEILDYEIDEAQSAVGSSATTYAHQLENRQAALDIVRLSVIVMLALSVIALICLFIFIMLSSQNIGAANVFGHIGNVISFLTAAAFVVILLIVNLGLMSSSADIDAIQFNASTIRLNASFGVWITLVASIINEIFMIVKGRTKNR